MTDITPRTEAPFIDRPKVAAAAFRASQGHRRRANEYRRWAAEAEAENKPAVALRWRGEAARCDALKWSDFATAEAYHG